MQTFAIVRRHSLLQLYSILVHLTNQPTDKRERERKRSELRACGLIERLYLETQFPTSKAQLKAQSIQSSGDN